MFAVHGAERSPLKRNGMKLTIQSPAYVLAVLKTGFLAAYASCPVYSRAKTDRY
jgi:hypothetical protein